MMATGGSQLPRLVEKTHKLKRPTTKVRDDSTITVALVLICCCDQPRNVRVVIAPINMSSPSMGTHRSCQHSAKGNMVVLFELI